MTASKFFQLISLRDYQLQLLETFHRNMKSRSTLISASGQLYQTHLTEILKLLRKWQNHQKASAKQK